MDESKQADYEGWALVVFIAIVLIAAAVLFPGAIF